jgi:serine protease Do
MAKTLSRVVTTVSVLLLLFLASSLTSWKITAATPAQQQPLSQSMIADLAKPAVVQVYSEYISTISAPDWGRNLDLLRQDLEDLANQGNFDPDDQQAVAEWSDALFLSDPSRYIAPAEAVRTTQATYSGFGSGFIVTPDGYIVTNAHVVSPRPQELQNTLVAGAIENFVFEDLQIVFPDFDPQREFLTEQEAAVAEAIQAFYQNNIGLMSMEDTQSNIFAISRFAVPGVVVSERGVPAELIPSATGEPIPGKDVAVIKIEGSNLPTVPLGDETTLQSLDRIIAIGFPGNIFFSEIIPQQGQEPTVTSGEFSGFQTTIEGWRAIQVQTPITSGNSGGPALDSGGRVIGIATFGVVDPVTGQESPSHNFLVPVSIVKDVLNRANIVPSEGAFTQMYRQALTHYSAGRYNEAIDILQQVNNLVPNNPYVMDYISRSQAELGSAAGGIAGNSIEGSNNFPQ